MDIMMIPGAASDRMTWPAVQGLHRRPIQHMAIAGWRRNTVGEITPQ